MFVLNFEFVFPCREFLYIFFYYFIVGDVIDLQTHVNCDFGGFTFISNEYKALLSSVIGL